MLGKTISHYRILEKLGEGGMGVVFKAHDTHLDRFAAIKVLPAEKVTDPERKRRFVQEAKAASALHHPNIITIYDIDQTNGVDWAARSANWLRPFVRQATDLVGLIVQAIHRGPQLFCHADLTNLLHDADDRVPVALFVKLSVLESCAKRRTSWKVSIRKGFVDDRHRRFRTPVGYLKEAAFAQERDDVAVLETAEAVERVRLRVDGKRRVAVIVERAYDHSNYGSLPSLIRRFAWVR